jgi:hypothetical protein
VAVTKVQLAKMILAFPGARESTAYGHPAWRIGEKFFTRLRDEDNSLVIHLDSFDERDMLLESDRKVFHITDHYRNSKMVLARIDKIDRRVLQGFLERRFRAVAGKKAVKEWEAGSR